MNEFIIHLFSANGRRCTVYVIDYVYSTDGNAIGFVARHSYEKQSKSFERSASDESKVSFWWKFFSTFLIP